MLTLACETAQRDCANFILMYVHSVSSERREQSDQRSQSFLILSIISIYTCQESHINKYAHRLRMQDRSIQQTHDTRKEWKYLQRTSFLVVEIRYKSISLDSCEKCNSFCSEMGLLPFLMINNIQGQQLSCVLVCLNNTLR